MNNIENNIFNIPILIIIGSTGAGKTKLSIDLAKEFNGEIINYDAIQIYNHLNIASAKITQNEINKTEIKHHLLSIIEPEDNHCIQQHQKEEYFSVKSYYNLALNKINEINENHHLPIFVGGTNLYIQSILWKQTSFLENKDDNINTSITDESGVLNQEDYNKWLNDINGDTLYNKLLNIDEKISKRFHPNDERRINRSLQIIYQNGQKYSDLLKQNNNNNNNNVDNRFNSSLIIWVHCKSKNELNIRLENRINEMIDKGIDKEVRDLYKIFKLEYNDEKEEEIKKDEEDNNSNNNNQYINQQINNIMKKYDLRGIYQGIGFKEFLPWLESLSDEELNDMNHIPNNDLFNQCINKLLSNTKKYSKSQIKWIKNKMLNKNIPIFEFDSSNISEWKDNVLEPCKNLINNFLNKEDYKNNFQDYYVNRNDNRNNAEEKKWMNHNCKICNVLIKGEVQWNIHLKSRKHKRLTKKRKRHQIEN